MKSLFISMLLPAVLLMLLACGTRNSEIPGNDEKTFNAYWNTGQAEISTYLVDQSIAGEMQKGTLTMIYVVEDFSKSKLIKLDEPKKHMDDFIRVMKLNTTVEFITGIAECNQMTSVFSPLDYQESPHCLKLVSASQDWGGQSFFQATWKGHRYELHKFSNADAEGTHELSVVNTWLEEEIWNKIRISPDDLPVGKIKMVPAFAFLRSGGKELKVYDAKAEIQKTNADFMYSLEYPELNRKLEIHFALDFPHRIVSWKEVVDKQDVVSATLSKTMMSDYWNHQHPKDSILRDSLDLPR